MFRRTRPKDLVVALLCAGACLLTVAAATDAPPRPERVVPGHAANLRADVAAPVVVIGVGSLTWSDVSADQTPQLWELLENGAAAAAVSVRQVSGSSCPADSWLSLSAGERSRGPRPDPDALVAGPELDIAPALRDTRCGPLPDVVATSDGQAQVTGWPELIDLQAGSDYDPELGLLAETLAEEDVCATAIGPGAALTLADGRGVVRRYRPQLGSDSFDCPLTLVDAGSVADPTRDLPTVDRRVREVLDQAPADATVLVLGLSEIPGDGMELGVALLTGPSLDGTPRFLVTTTTRWDGVIRLLDVPSTIMTALDLPDPAAFYGAPLRLGSERPAEPRDTVRALEDVTRTDQVLRRWSATFATWPGAAQLVLYGVALLLLARLDWRPRWSGRLFTALAFGFAALPVAAYLVTVTRWWRAESPDRALWVGMLVIAAALALLAARLPARRLWWAGGASSLVTFAVLTWDGVTGSALHRGSLMGPSPALGGRFYGFGNPTFSVYVVVAFVLAGAVAAELLARERRGWAVASVLGIGAIAVVVDVWPTWGADIGGGLALLPGLALLTSVAAGLRVTLVRLAASAVAGVTLVAAIAGLDWLRPEAERSHAGRFVQDILDGDAGEMVVRKAGYAWASLGAGPTAWVTVVVLVMAAATLLRPERLAPPSLRAALRQWPTLHGTLGAVLVTVVIGAFVNDYGVRIGTIALTAALPLVALTCARAQSVVDTAATSTGTNANTDSSTSSSRARVGLLKRPDDVVANR